MFAGDVVHDSGNRDRRIDIRRRTGIRQIRQLGDDRVRHEVVAGDDAVDTRMARFILIHAEAFGQRLLDLIAFGGFERHFPPVVIGAGSSQFAGWTYGFAVFEVRAQHLPDAFEHRLRESRIGILTVLIGRIVGKQHLDMLWIIRTRLIQSQLVHQLLSLQHTDLFGVGHLHEGIRNVPL